MCNKNQTGADSPCAKCKAAQANGSMKAGGCKAKKLPDPKDSKATVAPDVVETPAPAPTN